MINNNFIRDRHFNDLISSTIIFFVTYLLVLYVSLFSTAFIAFTNGINVPLNITGIDFEVASSSGSQLWDNVDNIFLIFSFSPLVLFIVLLACVMFTHKVRSKTIGVFLFWMIFNCILRLFGDLTFGLIFHLWQSNLLTDFLGLTDSLYGKLIFIALGLIAMAFLPLLLRNLTTYFFDPILTDNLQRDTKSNFILPAIISCLVLLLWFLPSFSFNELGVVIMSAISTAIFSHNVFSHFNYINLSSEQRNNEGFNIELSTKSAIVILSLLVIVKIILSIGLHFYSSDFQANYLSNIFHIVLICILVIVILVFISYVIFKKNKKKQEIVDEVQQTDDALHSEAMPEDFLKGTKWENQNLQLMKEKAEKLNVLNEAEEN